MTDRTRAIELAKRLDALAKRGVDGEKANAMAMLDAHMRKHGINEDDLMSLDLHSRRFMAPMKDMSDPMIKLMAQSIASSCRRTVGIYRLSDQRNRFAGFEAEVTNEEHAEASLKIEVMLPLFLKELEVFTSAFLLANKLMGHGAEPPEELTPEELAHWRRAHRISDNITKGNILKRLS